VSIACCKKVLDGGNMAVFTQEKAHGLPGSVDRPIEMTPFPSDPEVCLIDMPGSSYWSSIPPPVLLKSK
jgi:hypothetical protein